MDFNELVLREIPNTVVVLTSEGRIAHWTRGAEKICGYHGPEAEGQLLQEQLVPQEQHAEEIRCLAQLKHTGSCSCESVRQTKSGVLIHVDVSDKTIHAQDGALADQRSARSCPDRIRQGEPPCRSRVPQQPDQRRHRHQGSAGRAKRPCAAVRCPRAGHHVSYRPARAKPNLLNLVNNAVKFTERGSILIGLRRRNGDGMREALISVRDSGIGIRKEDLARLFEAFSQAGSGSTRRYEGSGLSLYLCQTPAALPGAQLAFASTYGEGIEFTLSRRERKH